MTMPLNHFLVVFNLREEALVDFSEFGSDVDRATEAYAEKEREYRNRGDRDDFEIVLVGADSRETLEVTHSRYFKRAEAVPF
jgi:hypothetical protein